MTSSWGGYGPMAPQPKPPGPDRKAKKSYARQSLSCRTCRERKVRVSVIDNPVLAMLSSPTSQCNRIKPCQACVDHGCSNGCEYDTPDGSDRSHIEQSDEIKRLRRENQGLRLQIQRLQDGQPPCFSDGDDDDQRSDRRGSTSTLRAAAARQRRFKTISRIDNLYFGTPGLANIVHDVCCSVVIRV